MALPFNESTRAIQADREWMTLLIAASALVLLMLWMIWLIWAPVSLYETGDLVNVTRRGLVVAAFPAQLAPRLQPGQLAILYVQDDTAQASLPSALSQAIMAVVTSVDVDASTDAIEVTLSTLSTSWPSTTLSTGYPISGSVAIEVEQVTPAQLLWRASGLGSDGSAVLFGSVSP